MTTCLRYLPNGTGAGGAPGVVLLVHPATKTIDASADIATASRRKFIGENPSPPLVAILAWLPFPPAKTESAQSCRSVEKRTRLKIDRSRSTPLTTLSLRTTRAEDKIVEPRRPRFFFARSPSIQREQERSLNRDSHAPERRPRLCSAHAQRNASGRRSAVIANASRSPGLPTRSKKRTQHRGGERSNRHLRGKETDIAARSYVVAFESGKASKRNPRNRPRRALRQSP